MAFTAITTDVANVAKQADKPQISAAALKAVFDQAGVDVKSYINNILIQELQAVSAAANLGATYVGDGDANLEPSRNIQAKLNYVYQVAKDATAGTIPDRSILKEKLALKTITADEIADGTISTIKVADGSITQAKLYADFIDMFPIGYGMEWWNDTLPSGKWLFAGSALTIGTHDTAIAFFGGSTLPSVGGKVVVGKSTDAEFNQLYKTGGEKTHTLIVNEIPDMRNLSAGWYNMGLTTGGDAYGYSADVTVESAQAVKKGGGLGHNNIQPYIVANYIFKVL